MNMRRTLTCLALAASTTPAREAAPSGRAPENAVFATCYFRYVVAELTRTQAAALFEKANEAVAAEARDALDSWHGARIDGIRKDLEGRFGDLAQSRFETFITRFTHAEQQKDAAELATIAADLALDPVPDSYGALRRAMIETVLASDMAEASRFLGDLQTWLDLKAKQSDAPDLDIWLARATAPDPRPKPPKPRPALQDAEADAGDLPAEIADTGSASPLDSFAALHKSRRDQAMKEAEAGMQQVAAERQAAEEEYATRKLARAQADAENMKRQAEKYAAVEKDALEQRKNSWGNRIKSIVGATLSSATGAFTGAIGARAAEEAVNAIFK